MLPTAFLRQQKRIQTTCNLSIYALFLFCINYRN
nr:MAG TPA: hypothetical protein [Caudoviricetes sp.]